MPADAAGDIVCQQPGGDAVADMSHQRHVNIEQGAGVYGQIPNAHPGRFFQHQI